ncbi:Protein FAR1-RELATED SEQUENCE 5 [Linum perenne]
MLRSRREAEKSEEYKARNTKPWVSFEYSEVVSRAAEEYTPKIFAMFQEQYSRIQEYQIDQNMQVVDSGILTCSVYKPIDGDRVDVRVVRADTQSRKVSCICKYWDTMGLLCRHSLLVMSVQGTFGNIKFKTLPDFYIKKRWTRKARAGHADISYTLPMTSTQDEEERYISLFSKFGFIVRTAYREEVLAILLGKHADALSKALEKGFDVLTYMLRKGIILNIVEDAGGDPTTENTTGANNQNKAPQIATKFPRKSKPSKNAPRFRVDNEIHCSKEKRK